MSRYAVLGPGGVGGLLTVALATSGHDVVVVAREQSVALLQERGFRLTSSVLGERSARPDVVAQLDREVDAVLVATKATGLTEALDLARPDAVGDALVVPFLNGIDHLAVLRERYPAVVAGVIRVEATRVAPGVIVHGSPFARIELAATGPLADRAATVVADLAGAGLEARLVEDEQAMLWGKLSFLAPFALLTTRYAAPAGVVRAEHADELRAVVEEVMAVSAASGGPGDPAPILAAVDAFGPDTKSSMLRDAENGRPLELDAIGGAVLRAAQVHGIPVPRIEALVEEIGAAG